MATHSTDVVTADLFAKRRSQSEKAIIMRALEIVERHMRRDEGGIKNPGDAEIFLRLKLAACPNEVFAAIYLDSRHRIITYEELFHGSVDETSVHTRVVLQRALHHNAVGMIIAHNHPSGVAAPSDSDRAITAELKAALQLIGVRVLDHIIIGAGNAFSFARSGVL
jgi:DNA repair protein RadC